MTGSPGGLGSTEEILREVLGNAREYFGIVSPRGEKSSYGLF